MYNGNERRMYKRYYPTAGDVLLIEDNPYDAEFMRRMLSKEAKRIDIATTFADGLYKARTRRYDNIIIDKMLPDGDGSKQRGEIIGAAQVNNPEVSVQVVSVEGQMSEKHEAIQMILGKDTYRAMNKAQEAVEQMNGRDKKTGDYCEQGSAIVKLKGKIEDFEKHMTEGKHWRIAVLGVIVTVIMQIIVFSSMWGEVKTDVRNNTKTLDRIVKILDQMYIPNADTAHD